MSLSATYHNAHSMCQCSWSLINDRRTKSEIVEASAICTDISLAMISKEIDLEYSALNLFHFIF